VRDLLFLGLRGIRTFRYTVDRALAGPYRDRARVLYVEDFLKEGAVTLEPGAEPVLHWGREVIALDGIRACYNLLMYLPRSLVRDGLIRAEDWHPYRARLTGLILALHRMAGLVINRPLLDAGNGSKPLQTFDLARHGFRVPRTLMTNAPAEARAFAEALNWRVIYKSTSSLPAVTNRLTPERCIDLEKIRACPILLQEEVAGPDVRAHVVGRQVFAERIDFSGGVDARYSPKATRKFLPIELPDEVRQRCVSFTAQSGLGIAGFDFKVCRETEAYVALEANPTPGYDAYDFRLGGCISEALLRLMADGPAAAAAADEVAA
jgi:hypothetical protein